MSKGPWTNEKNDLIVADYFAMLAEDMAGRSYNKAQHPRGLMPFLQSRTEGSIDRGKNDKRLGTHTLLYFSQ